MAIAAAYFDAWNHRDAAGLASLFVEDGLFHDPMLRLPVAPYDLHTVVDHFGNAFPDFRFDLLSVQENAEGGIVLWSMTGTNQNPLKPGLPASQRTITVQGSEALEYRDGKIVSARRIFDTGSLFESLGFQVIVEPRAVGKMAFGYSLHASSGNPNPPGLLAITWIAARDESEKNRIREHSRQIIQDFLAEPGFIGIVTGFADRGFTVSAWETEEALHRALDKQHANAKHDFKSADLSPAVWTSIWKPERINRLWTRCPSCQQPNDVSDDHRDCSRCGAELPLRPPYW